jgi:hypothetical protein
MVREIGSDPDFALVVGQIEFGLGQLGAVLFGFEVEIEGVEARPTSSARVVLPTWRGPSKATAGVWARASLGRG